MTKKDLNAAVEELAAIPYFPQGSGARLAIAVQMGKFVENNQKLRWLVDSAVTAMDEWRGVGELRGLYCTRYKPSDGIERHSTLPGYTPADNEARYEQEQASWAMLDSGLVAEEVRQLAESKRLK